MIPGMLNDEEKSLGAMLAGPVEKEDDKEESEFDDGVALDALTEDMMQAFEMKDARAFRAALEGFLDMIQMKPKEDLDD